LAGRVRHARRPHALKRGPPGGDSKLPLKHDDGKDDNYLGFAFVEGLPRVFIVIAEVVAIIGGASINHDPSSQIPELLKSIGHPPGDRRQLYQGRNVLSGLNAGERSVSESVCFVRSAGRARSHPGRSRLRPQPTLPNGRPEPQGKPVVSHISSPITILVCC
jgi:hypothetical protein